VEGYPNSEAIHAAQIEYRQTPLLAAADEWQRDRLWRVRTGTRCDANSFGRKALTVGASRRPIRPGRTAWQVRTNQIWSQADAS
jgi:hypothetical protein